MLNKLHFTMTHNGLITGHYHNNMKLKAAM